MSRKYFRLNLVALLACTALIFAALGCESVTGPDSTPNSSLSTSGDVNFTQSENVNG
jgi:hypothetical protein